MATTIQQKGKCVILYANHVCTARVREAVQHKIISNITEHSVVRLLEDTGSVIHRKDVGRPATSVETRSAQPFQTAGHIEKYEARCGLNSSFRTQ
jgi:hypothetical protein